MPVHQNIKDYLEIMHLRNRLFTEKLRITVTLHIKYYMYSHEFWATRLKSPWPLRCTGMLTGDLPRNAGGSCNLVIKGAVVNRVTTTLVELHYI